MAALGIGVKVYVGWTHDTDDPGALCRTGTIVDGPFPAGYEFLAPNLREIYVLQHKSWDVALDSGRVIGAAESVLFPIDSDPATEIPDTMELERTT